MGKLVFALALVAALVFLVFPAVAAAAGSWS